MLTIISPAKTLDVSRESLFKTQTQPKFQSQTADIISILKNLKIEEIAKLMNISNKLAEINFLRFQNFDCKNFNIDNSFTAILTFDGDVYEAIKLKEVENSQYFDDLLNFAQNNLLILSGLYGILRPLDIIQPYRLEMGTSFKQYPINNITNLYQFWQDKITDYLNLEILQHKEKTLINLASQEYFDVINRSLFKGKVININFQEYRNNKLTTIAINSKRARGLMTRFILDNKITSSEEIVKFSSSGYQYHSKRVIDQKTENWLFVL